MIACATIQGLARTVSDRLSVVVEYSDDSGQRHKIVYEAAENGNWERTAYARRGCEWRPVGTETVSALRVDDDRPQTRAFRGPE